METVGTRKPVIKRKKIMDTVKIKLTDRNEEYGYVGLEKKKFIGGSH